MSTCIYCQSPADSLEHPLPAAFGEFDGAPSLANSVCQKCNNGLGLLDEQLARCGPEAFLRKHYGVQGRSTHDKVNPFERGSAGGHRLNMRAKDANLGIDVAIECENGVYRQMRQLIFVEKSGKTHHLPIRENTSSEQLLTAFRELGVVQPFEVCCFSGPEEKDWVERLIKETWPSATFGESSLGSSSYDGATGTVEVTDRYFRAIVKIGFHYFLTQCPAYTGHELMFSGVRQFIVDGGVDRVNEFIGKRQHPLLGEMLTPGARPDGWRTHVLCAETRPGECLAHVQMFLSEDWSAPVYTVRLARDASIVDLRAIGHAYVYYEAGPKGKYSGQVYDLTTTRADFPTPPSAPVITAD